MIIILTIIKIYYISYNKKSVIVIVYNLIILNKLIGHHHYKGFFIPLNFYNKFVLYKQYVHVHMYCIDMYINI